MINDDVIVISRSLDSACARYQVSRDVCNGRNGRYTRHGRYSRQTVGNATHLNCSLWVHLVALSLAMFLELCLRPAGDFRAKTRECVASTERQNNSF